MRTNRELLSQGTRVLARKRKKQQIEEIVFDPLSRRDFVTGFHKRKVQRKKKAQEVAKERERLERIEQRKKIRQNRADALNQRAGANNLEQTFDSDAGWQDATDEKQNNLAQEDIYSDVNTKVTITAAEDLFSGAIEGDEATSNPSRMDLNPSSQTQSFKRLGPRMKKKHPKR